MEQRLESPRFTAREGEDQLGDLGDEAPGVQVVRDGHTKAEGEDVVVVDEDLSREKAS